ncbi:General secretion pathway protein G [Dehalobacter sp. UNSWDHB]|jgi:prepilin-type N-terminal cleavage/methylation domain|uniref:type II secretion system protein n=1 Tax=unclassified Dehalobacter TaxID=2635733 RepID=UPI00028B50AA|nr:MULTISPECIES: type II secretion system protein GspG [unclassified Dehalobacter]AFV01449.1 prepilin-type N-terminal cleavage/methylation domain protein [Dehalobacter sp. DCA]AFV04486.1 prepilin-type N-terminal cleavage/methylation domain protein [Dehalobacter sp. CF]EQB20586.1 General secretion pathway protein G [Dehalobacter sp. UNSWDHB]
MPKACKNGFTLWEVLLVIALLGILASMILPCYSGSINSTESEVHKVNVLKIESAARLYRLDVGSYPGSLNDLITCPSADLNWQGPYLEEIPACPFDPSKHYALDDNGKAVIR